MRTRIFNKMMAMEVEDYLARGGNTIYVGVGVTEVHGALPIDCETILPEAFALEMAEQSDGLALINLPYFFPGGTIISNATVQVTVRDGIDYLMMLSRSLVSQGFRKIFFVSGHGPASLYIDAMCRDFFQETKIHVCHINLMGAFQNFGPKESDPMGLLDKMVYGAYKKMKQIDFLPVDPDAVEIPRPPREENSPLLNLQKALRPFGSRASIYFSALEQHGGGKPFASEAERLAACEAGEKMIYETVSRMDLEGLKDAIDGYHVYVQAVVEKFPRIK